jgi:DNA-binding response OmpR family regulator
VVDQTGKGVMEQEKILIVDDSLELLSLLTMVLQQSYQVFTAMDGKKGLEMAQQLDPDVILLDMSMPRMDGMEMLTALRKTDIQAPVIFMTAAGSEVIAVQAFRLGVTDYLSKPFAPTVVLEAIDQALNNKRLAREKEQLQQKLISVEATRQTVATLAHHINNHLMVAQGNLTLLEEELAVLKGAEDLAQWLSVIDESQKSMRTITAVLRVMQRLITVEQTHYHSHINLINIENALKEELRQMEERSTT